VGRNDPPTLKSGATKWISEIDRPKSVLATMSGIDPSSIIASANAAIDALGIATTNITTPVSEVIASPCRPAMGGVYSVNSAKVCHCPSIGVGPLMDGLLRTTRLRPVYALSWASRPRR